MSCWKAWTGAEIERVRSDYESRHAPDDGEMLKRHGRSSGSIRYQAKTNGWMRHPEWLRECRAAGAIKGNRSPHRKHDPAKLTAARTAARQAAALLEMAMA